jgi:hypothetical protein
MLLKRFDSLKAKLRVLISQQESSHLHFRGDFSYQREFAMFIIH